MEVPRQKHQTQPLYTAPRLSDRFDRASPLNSRRTAVDSYHDNNKSTSSMQMQSVGRQLSKNHRRHSTNTSYTSSLANNLSHKELSPTNSLGTNGQNFYEKSIKGNDAMVANINISTSNNSSGSSNQKYNTKKVIKRKKITTTTHFDSSSGSSSTSGNSTVKHHQQQSQNNNSNATSNSSNSQNHMGKSLKISGTSSR